MKKDNILDDIDLKQKPAPKTTAPGSAPKPKPESEPASQKKVVVFKKPEPKNEEYVPPTPLGSWDTEFGKVVPLGSHEGSTRLWLRSGFLEAVKNASEFAVDVVLNDACVTFKPGDVGRFLSLGFENPKAAISFLSKFEIGHRVHADTKSLRDFLREKGVLVA